MNDKNKATDETKAKDGAQKPKPEEIGGSDKPDPVRYGDWEINGRCIDF